MIPVALLYLWPGDRSHHQQLLLLEPVYTPLAFAYAVTTHCLALFELKYLLASVMLSRNILSVVLLPGDVLYDGFLSAVTVVLIILLCSSALNALLIKVPFSHFLNEHISHVTFV